MEPLYICFHEKTETILNNKAYSAYPIGSLLFSFLEFDWEQLEKGVAAKKEKIEQIPHSENSILTGYKTETRNYLSWATPYQEIYSNLEEAHPLLAKTVDCHLENTLDTAFPNMPTMAHFVYRIFYFYPREPMSPEFIEEFAQLYDKPLPDASLIQATDLFIDKTLELCRSFQAFKQELLQMIDFVLDTEGAYSNLSIIQRYYLMQISNFAPYKQNKKLFEEIRIMRHITEYPKAPDNVSETYK